MSGYIKEMRKLIGTRPLMVVGATVIAFNEREEILLQLRSDIKKWGLPGGAMEYGETLEETAIRELFEETGLKANRLTFVDILSGKQECHKYPNGDEVFGVTTVYFTEDIYGELSINDRESLNLKFFPLNNLPSNLVEKAKYIIDKHLLSPR
ncbi:NUDIX hydrolase [Neobacillus massiliamazoniensis]|uniref:MutT/nudix family protein n=1 Tax=Neobacillus massiliamazoniensis TaxID=1499688 RepID=A0A0U1NWK3_9BACI|nr:NUDIX hydrolase [Neobacillus massiliamazoniensis]CRK82390.1 mutT/nudix family protein [Neobacillus massiliamazoniensis]